VLRDGDNLKGKALAKFLIYTDFSIAKERVAAKIGAG